MPWICDRCGEVAEGDMCLGCGHVGRSRAVGVGNHPYAGIVPTSSPTGSNKLMRWSPMTWIALVGAVMFILTILLGLPR